MSESYQWDFGSVESGLQFKVVFDGTSFTATCISGYLDLNALWFSDGDKSVEGTVTLSKSENSLNLNGTGITWDDYYKVFDTGLGSAGVNKVSYLTPGESMSFSLDTLALPPAITSLLTNPTHLILGVRTTSNSSLSGDGKYVDTCATKISSVNHAPELSATLTAHTYVDTSADDPFDSVTGSLTTADRDAGDTKAYAIDADGVVSDEFVVNGTTYQQKLAGSYGTLYLNASGAYEYVPNDGAIEALKEDDSEAFTLSVTDGSGATDTATLTISLTGANDTPELSATLTAHTYVDTSADDPFGSVTGSLTTADRDAGDTKAYAIDADGVVSDEFVVHGTTYQQKLVGSYGTLYLNASGAYEYVPNDDVIEALKKDDSEAFTLSVTDGSGATDTATLTISLTGANDTPELSATLTAHTYVDTSADDPFGSVTGSLSTADRDAGDTKAYVIAADGVVSDQFVVHGTTYQQKLVGSYGTLYLNASGAYEYVPNDDAIEALEANASESFALKVTDGSGATDTATLTINLTGAQDAPVVAPVLASYVDTAADDTFDDKTGTLSVSSRDNDTSFTFAMAGSSESLMQGYDRQNTSSTYGTLYLNSSTGAYKFVANDAAIEALVLGSNPSLVYNVTAAADGAISDNQTITINLTGANDAPRDLALTAVDSFANGNSIPGSGANKVIGSLSVPAGADPDGGGDYSYSLDNAIVRDLAGENDPTGATGTFTVSSDGLLSATQDLGPGNIYEVTVKVSQGEGASLTTYSETFSIVTGTNNNSSSENLPGSGYDFSSGDDVIYGRGGTDIILAGSGNDTVFGQNGNDEIHGGDGTDLLYGGNGNDIFAFSANDTGITLATADTIADFSSADDTIATTLAAGNVTIADGSGLLNFAAFVTAANAVLTNGAGTNDAYMAWNAANSGNGWLVIDENDNGSVDNGDSLIVLTGVNTAGEFSTTDIA